MSGPAWWLPWSVAVLLSAAASVSDIRSGRIPNRLVLLGLLSGLGLAYVLGAGGWGFAGGAGLLAALQGLLAGALLLLPLYLLRLLGAGDVKLMAALGALLGWPGVGWLAALSLLAAGLLALLLALRWGIAGRALRHVRDALWGGALWLAAGGGVRQALQVPLSGRRSPHAVAVLLGVLVYGGGLWADWGLW